MKAAALVAVLFASPAVAQQQETWAERFARSYEQGARIRLMKERANESSAIADYYRAQSRILGREMTALDEKLKRVEAAERRLLDLERRASASSSATPDPTTTMAAAEQVRAIMAAFEYIHPDWREHEQKMTYFANRFPPGRSVEPLEWLEAMYTLAKSPLGARTEIVQRKE